MLFIAESFINPYSPYLVFNENVCHTSIAAAISPTPIQIHLSIRNINIINNRTKRASRPTAKIHSSRIFSPCTSTHQPITFLLGYSAMAYRKNERKIVAATIKKIHAPNQLAAVLLVSGSPLENLP